MRDEGGAGNLRAAPLCSEPIGGGLQEAAAPLSISITERMLQETGEEEWLVGGWERADGVCGQKQLSLLDGSP